MAKEQAEAMSAEKRDSDKHSLATQVSQESLDASKAANEVRMDNSQQFMMIQQQTMNLQ